MRNSNKDGLAVVTGASSGIGAVYADRLAALGHPLLLIARRANRLEALAAQLQNQHNIDVETLALDLTSADDLRTLEERLESDNVEVLVNNAGGGGLGPLSSTNGDKMEALVRLNIVAATRLSQAALGGFRQRGKGTLINLGSIIAFWPSATAAVYSGTKNYILNFTRSVAMEFEDTDIRIQVVMPGPVRTEFFSSQGMSDSVFPDEYYITADQLVDAALAGLEQGEIVTNPTMEDPKIWEDMERARANYFASVSSGKVASRYLST
ncbi:SDR family oxidoreductase [Arenicella chitinivorans]|uniref:NADP-dependent 3-hydroxy acid dehydrogenase YdfG n=1 Tax=Arenicella chitinivorans TaxID=1329800 RepID=A0A918S249_9GAMM|nr:SDR family NAD(P)-dependent oxidoreductase [Arenicella chitinivorans]GHA20716.1 SDR family oxidoreductase [Arenicella chitinivorans]